VDFLLFYPAVFVIKSCTYSSVEMLMAYMVRAKLGIAELEHMPNPVTHLHLLISLPQISSIGK